jgi:hypothetical protein
MAAEANILGRNKQLFARRQLFQSIHGDILGHFKLWFTSAGIASKVQRRRSQICCGSQAIELL